MTIEVLTQRRGLFVVSKFSGYAKHPVRARYEKYRAFFVRIRTLLKRYNGATRKAVSE